MKPLLHIVLLFLLGISVSVTESALAQDEGGVQIGSSSTTDSTEGVSSYRVRRRIQELRGTPRRVIYPIIIVTDGDNQGDRSPQAIAQDRAVQQRLSRLRGYGVDPVTGRVVAMPDSLLFDGVGVDSAAVEREVADILARDQSLRNDPRAAREANIALANQIALLRGQLAQARLDEARSQRNQDETIRLLTNRVSGLERDLDLMLAGWPAGQENARDTVVVIRSDTVRQIIEQRPRVDTVVVVREPGPPTVVEIERALLDEGLFQTVDVLFEFNKSTLLPASRNVLKSVAQVLQAHPEIQIEIGGHTDSSGPDSYNKTLSERRAESVKDYLVNEERIPVARLSSVGFGESQPTANNASPTGRALNRRVAFKVVHE